MLVPGRQFRPLHGNGDIVHVLIDHPLEATVRITPADRSALNVRIFAGSMQVTGDISVWPNAASITIFGKVATSAAATSGAARQHP